MKSNIFHDRPFNDKMLAYVQIRFLGISKWSRRFPELIKAAFNAVKACGLLAPSFRNLDSAPIKFVTDRLGHDKRYSISSEKLRLRTGWQEKETIDLGLMKTVRWIKQNKNYSWGSKPI